jgi:RNA polymerase sigma-70 factor, ECF subfamily
MDALAEQELIARCRQGDERAFRELVERYRGLVFGLAVRTLDDRARAEDIAQEVFLRVYRGLPYFRGEAQLSTWIYRITANLLIEERQRAGATMVSLDAARDPIDDRAPFEPGTADRSFDAIELKDRLQKALMRLPAPYQILVEGHYLKGLRYEDLAEALDLPMGTVKTHLHRAKRRLRELLETELE